MIYRHSISISLRNIRFNSTKLSFITRVSLDCIIDDIFTSFDAIQSQYSNCPIFTFGRSSGAYLSLLIARDRDIDGVIDFYGYSGINTEPFKMANSYYAKTAQSVNETVLAQLHQHRLFKIKSPNVLIYGYAWYR